ncbi:MAG: tRNA (adenosine(37)-N6)-threonylcarbamoyltransferase complex transferase subunit TsaD [Actinomycetota bacterium]|nr:tRNA (adenosine(37)-N6)-threonylcarbamoyltransferase complex transferase subunit TsaD [Actinomycetota bacterium]
MSADILAIETSCDETAAAVVRDGRDCLGAAVSSQIDLHARFGGVVPEIASRSHQEVVNLIIDEALAQANLLLSEVDAVAVTRGPGLPGALIVGVAAAKALAYGAGKPLIGINHLEGHIFANFFTFPDLAPPFVALVVSGGHTLLAYIATPEAYEVLGQTLDDAAGEAFDKVAGYLELGYPGGPILEKLAAEGDPGAINFPRAMIKTADYDFSLSGLKTAVLYYVTKKQAAGEDLNLPDLAAGFQAAVIDVQVYKTVKAAEAKGAKTVVLAGGVAANQALKDRLGAEVAARGWRLFAPPLGLCTDNAIMIAAAAWPKWLRRDFLALDAEPDPNMKLGRYRAGLNCRR